MKVVLNSTPNLPALFMFFQSAIKVLLLTFTALFTSQVKLSSFDIVTAIILTPLILVDASGIMFSALCLRDVEAAFYQIARGLDLPLTIIVLALLLMTRPSIPAMGCAALVTLGFLLGISFSEGLPSKALPTPLALFYGVLSSLTHALHPILVIGSLPSVVPRSSTTLYYWSSLGSAILLGVLAYLKGEVWQFYVMVTNGNWDWSTFLWGNIVTGVCGFLVAIAGSLVINVTSPATRMFLSTARIGFQFFLSIKIFGDVFTIPRAISIATILTGTVLRTYVKSGEQSTPPAPPTAADVEAQAPLMDSSEIQMDSK
ncbi:hypothetical protein FPV67DRAFT_1563482 [Lyophyllum atratum]|nr:hypothetical protein FPV67DRAFT_1563482 [Lyophyllum atratum]